MVTFTLFKPDGTALFAPVFGLVDSGADGSMFPMDVMPALGISQSDCAKKPQLGSSGRGECYEWNGGTLPADFWGITVNLKMDFSDTPFILLGRTDFFSYFTVAFDQRRRRFVLESY